MNTALKAAATNTPPANPVAKFSHFIDRFKPQLSLALPKHLNADRMARLAVTAFSTNEKLQQCTDISIVASIMTAAQLGLEPGVNGHAFLVPYGKTCTLVPGWKGLVDLVSRGGRAAVWTGAVFAGDEFDYALGDSPFVKHKPGDEDDPKKLTHVYAIGAVNGQQHKIIEVWKIGKVWKHRDKYNKVGTSHYSFRDPEMYARKIPLLQVLKYVPSSVELQNAMTIANASDMGQRATINPDGFVSIIDLDPVTGEINAPTPTDSQLNATVDRQAGTQKAGAKTAAAKKTAAAPPDGDLLGGAETRTFAQFAEAINKAKTHEDALLELDAARGLPAEQQTELNETVKRKFKQ
jgi:recombination protein RecT